MIFWMSSTAMGSTPGERFVQQDESRIGGKCAGNLGTSPFAARQADSGIVADVGDVQIVQQGFQPGGHLGRGVALQLQARPEYFSDTVQAAKNEAPVADRPVRAARRRMDGPGG